MFFKRKAKDNQNHSVAVDGKVDGKLSSDFILSAIEDGVIMVSSTGIIQLVNPAAAKITGWPAHEAVGLDYQSVLHLVDDHNNAYPPESHPFTQALSTGKPARDSRAFLQTRNSKMIPISIIVSPVAATPGQASQAAVAVFRDITAERQEEARRNDFISTASHEMRTPIAAVEGYLSMALNPKIAQIDERGRTLLQKAYTATTHLGELFKELLTSSRAEDGRLASYPSVVEVGELMAQTADAGKFNAQKKGLEIKFIVNSNSGQIRGGKVIRPLFFAFVDPNRLREVIQNLIDNAIKYTPKGTITLALTGDQHVIQIQIHDTGAGIPEEDIPHLFQKFYRVDSSFTRTVGGNGLGLYIAKRIIELYQGRIWVESQLNKGSTFFINLPRITTERALELQQTQANLIKPDQQTITY